MDKPCLPKPLYGEPCNGCGLCCLAVPCPIAEELLSVSVGSCPALEYEDGRFWCGLIRNAHKHLPGMRDKPWVDEYMREFMLGTGAFNMFCDSEDY